MSVEVAAQPDPVLPTEESKHKNDEIKSEEKQGSNKENVNANLSQDKSDKLKSKKDDKPKPKEEEKPKGPVTFDKDNFVEAPIPKTNPWNKPTPSAPAKPTAPTSGKEQAKAAEPKGEKHVANHKPTGNPTGNTQHKSPRHWSKQGPHKDRSNGPHGPTSRSDRTPHREKDHKGSWRDKNTKAAPKDNAVTGEFAISILISIRRFDLGIRGLSQWVIPR